MYRYAWGSPRGKHAGAWMNAARETLYNRVCRVIARGGMNSCIAVFEDGTSHVISRNALRRII